MGGFLLGVIVGIAITLTFVIYDEGEYFRIKGAARWSRLLAARAERFGERKVYRDIFARRTLLV